MLMGVLCFHADLSRDIYTTLRNWMGRLPGGLAMSTVGGLFQCLPLLHRLNGMVVGGAGDTVVGEWQE